MGGRFTAAASFEANLSPPRGPARAAERPAHLAEVAQADGRAAEVARGVQGANVPRMEQVEGAVQVDDRLAGVELLPVDAAADLQRARARAGL